MADRTVTAIPIAGQTPAARLEPDAIGAAQDTIIGMGNSAPTVALGLVLAYLAATSAYGSGPIIVLCGIPMLIIANAYRRLNLWSANCGASFEWVGRAINPYLGFMTGWLMIAASLIAAVSGVVVLGPSVLAIAGVNAVSTWPNISISTAVIVVLLAIAAATDGIDGFLARRYNWVSRLGSYLDPISDKLLLTSVFLCLAFADLVPAWLVWLIVAATVCACAALLLH